MGVDPAAKNETNPNIDITGTESRTTLPSKTSLLEGARLAVRRCFSKKKSEEPQANIETVLKGKVVELGFKPKHLYNLIQSRTSETTQQPLTKEEQTQLYDNLKTQFDILLKEDSISAWIDIADILDAVDLLALRCGKTNEAIKQIEVSPPEKKATWTDFKSLFDTKKHHSSHGKTKKHDVLLVPYSKAVEVTTQLERSYLHKSRQFVEEQIATHSTKESSKVAPLVAKMTAPGVDNLFAKVLQRGYRRLTRFMAGNKNKHLTAKSVAKQSKQLGIKSYEIIYQKSFNEERGRCFYRGPKFLFGKSVHEYATFNEWFKRDLTEDARGEYLCKVNTISERFEGQYGKMEASLIAGAAGDCRVAPIKTLEPGSFGQLQELHGKVLNEEAVQQAKGKGDTVSYYHEKYQFTAKNLLGRKTDDLVKPQLLASKKVSRLKAQARAVRARGNKDSSAQRQKILKSNESILQHAQHELLGGIYRFFDNEGAVQVVQRLAPADVHNYVAPVNGTPLSHEKAVEVLEKRLQQKMKHLKENGQDFEMMRQEIQHLQKLKEVFLAQETLLGRASQTTLDIHGVSYSVSAPAIRNQSKILAQNDRKVMLFLHDDGNLSMHVFIGATGVNKVDVDTSPKRKKQGDRQGDMQFGPDVYRADADRGHFAAKDNQTRDGLGKLRMGETAGGFPINGSTVISYYMPTDFTVIPEVEQYQAVASYGVGKKRIAIELQCSMGDPLLVKTEIRMAEFLEKHLDDDDFDSCMTADAILKKADEIVLPEGTHVSDQDILNRIKKLLSGEEVPTFSKTQLKKSLKILISKRLYVLRKGV